MTASESGSLEIFVSYSHADADVVLPEIHWLRDQGVRVWYDEGIQGGSRWRDAIAEQIAACRLFVLYVSNASAESPVCREELEYALDQGIEILAIHIEATELPQGMRLGIMNRQGILRHELADDAYRSRLIEAVNQHSDAHVEASTTMPVVAQSSKRTIVAVAIVVALGVGISFGFGAATFFDTDPPPAVTEPPVVFTLDLPEGRNMWHGTAGYEPVGVSGDGTLVAYASRGRDGPHAVVARRLGRTERTNVASVPYLRNLFVSPDGQSVGYYGANHIATVPVAGGDPRVLVRGVLELCGFFGASWGIDGSIVYADCFGGINRVSADGGDVSELTVAQNGVSHMHPHISPNGETLLYVEWQPETGDGSIYAHRLGDDQDRATPLIANGFLPHLTADGLLVFLRGDALWGARIDLEKLVLLDRPIRLRDDLLIEINPGKGSPHATFDLAANGLLAYRPAGSAGVSRALRTLKIADRDGRTIPVDLPPADYELDASWSPDGCCILLNYTTNGVFDLWRFDIERGALQRITSTAERETNSLWSPSGDEILYSQASVARDEAPSLYTIAARGGGIAKQLTKSRRMQFATQWHAPTNTIFLREVCDLAKMAVDATPVVEIIRATGHCETNAVLSPDGGWLAYVSDEVVVQRGDDVPPRGQVYVRPFPNVDDDQLVVSIDGGWDPFWHPDGSRLFFLTNSTEAESGLVSVAFDQGRIGAVEPAYAHHPDDKSELLAADIDPSGERFLLTVFERPDDLPTDRVVVVPGFGAAALARLEALE